MNPQNIRVPTREEELALINRNWQQGWLMLYDKKYEGRCYIGEEGGVTVWVRAKDVLVKARFGRTRLIYQPEMYSMGIDKTPSEMKWWQAIVRIIILIAVAVFAGTGIVWAAAKILSK